MMVKHLTPLQTVIWKDMCTLWSQQHYLQSHDLEAVFIGRWMDEDIIHIYNWILLSHKKEWNNAICSNMNGPKDCHIEWRKSEKEKYRMISLICRILKQMIQMNLFTKQKQIHRLENEFMVTTRGYEWGEGIIREFGVDMYTLLYLKWTNKDCCIVQGTLLNIM